MWFPHFKHGQHAMDTNRFTNAEFADIHFIYRLANRNRRIDDRLYGERYPMRRQRNHQMLARMHQNLNPHSLEQAILPMIINNLQQNNAGYSTSMTLDKTLPAKAHTFVVCDEYVAIIMVQAVTGLCWKEDFCPTTRQ
ncbi:hypothetical protein TNCV_3341591 [Trichonephila clavipes]|nr:hypothetical protein TNCV_3341591 [Trichonephila clavipes]